MSDAMRSVSSFMTFTASIRASSESTRAVEQRLAVHAHHVQRRLQLVGNVRDEFRARVARVELLGDVAEHRQDAQHRSRLARGEQRVGARRDPAVGLVRGGQLDRLAAKDAAFLGLAARQKLRRGRGAASISLTLWPTIVSCGTPSIGSSLAFA